MYPVTFKESTKDVFLDFLAKARNKYQVELHEWQSNDINSSFTKSVNYRVMQKGINYNLNQVFPSLQFFDNKQSLENIDLFYSFLFKSTIAIKIRELMSDEDIKQFYLDSLKAYVEKYVLLGEMDFYIATLAHITKTGMDNILQKFDNQFGESENLMRKEIQRHSWVRDFIDTGSCHAECEVSFYSQTTMNGRIEEIFVGGLQNQSSTDKWKNPYEFIAPTFLSWTLLDMSEIIIQSRLLDNYLRLKHYPENQIRKKKGIPEVGFGWVQESKLFYQVKSQFAKEVVLQHYSPKWLGRQHLDIFLPKWNIAIEYQGEQHYRPIDFFGGEEAFIKNLKRDKRKKKLCEKNGCELIYANIETNFDDIITKLKHLIENGNF